MTARGALAGHYALQSLPKNPYGGVIYFDQNSSAYTSNLNDYGEGRGDCSYVECIGAITTAYTWVRDKVPDPENPGQEIDDPIDNPPQEVISQEYCRVEALAHAPFGNHFASADNGLGFESQSGSDLFDSWAVSEGTLYTKRAGGQDVVLTCTPHALALSDYSQAYAAVNYRSQILVPKVKLEGVTRFYQPHRLKFLTGQQITASIPAFGLAVSQHVWNVTSPSPSLVIFKDFVIAQDLTSGGRTIHGAADFALPMFSFYTVGDGVMDVKCNLTLTLPADSRFAGGLPSFQAKAWQSDSVWPKVTEGVLSWGEVTTFDECFTFGSPSQEGADWRNVAVAIASPFSQSGSCCFVQLITIDRHLYRNAGGGYPAHFLYQRQNALDANFPYPRGTGTWQLPARGWFYDSPLQPLIWNANDGGGNDWYSSTASDSFSAWVMYRPPPYASQATRWVPLSQMAWAWSGSAQKQGGVWQPAVGSGGLTQAVSPTTAHPTWHSFSPSPFSFAGVP